MDNVYDGIYFINELNNIAYENAIKNIINELSKMGLEINISTYEDKKCIINDFAYATSMMFDSNGEFII